MFCGFVQPARAAHEEWNRHWDGPTHQDDTASKIAVDKDGNVFVAGTSAVVSGTQGDYRLVKYSPDGTELWNRRYDGPGRNADSVTGLALDSAGNAYVTGFSYGVSTDYATLKYASDGSLLWVRRYDGPSQSDDFAAAVAVDAAGNAYVTGTSAGTNTQTDYATLKYSPDGDVLWTRRYNGPSSGDDTANALAVDSAGNAYVTGSVERLDSSGNYAGSNCATVKYSTQGRQVWAGLTAGGGSGFGTSIAVDAKGQVYVGGGAYSAPVNGDGPSYLIIKYTKNGTLRWYQLFPTSVQAAVSGVAVDGAGNVFVTGGGGTVKYDSDAGLRWVHNNEDGFGQAVAVDAAGNAYVAGYTYTSRSNIDFSLLKYGADGNVHWKRFFDGPSHGRKNSTDIANAIALDDDGNVYVTGSSTEGTLFSDMRTVKYSQ